MKTYRNKQEESSHKPNTGKARSSHSVLLAKYRNLLDPGVDPTCPQCGLEDQTVDHWLHRCPASVNHRLRVFGSINLPPNVLCTHPTESLALAKATLDLNLE